MLKTKKLDKEEREHDGRSMEKLMGEGSLGESGGEREGSHRMGGPAGSSGPPRRQRIPEPCRLELGDGGGGERDEDAGLAASR